ncbi:Serine/threonine kinase, cell division control protein 7 related [Giardia duodenalis]|uniref:non-specific serine/threonine protein kinase n=1 Tax=Giardia intestinalis TaxID=5741 RepID=V6TZV3_GIAIN|nr:Serine/threonine kinase, cell division control protein 7 related [Giardia intestinalis]
MKRDKLLLNGKYSINVKTNGERTYKSLCNIDGIVPAIKIYRLSDVSKSSVDFDQKEVDTAARSLLQPNLVKYLDAFTDKDYFYVVMEYVPNSLDQIIAHQRTTERLAALYITQIVKGLIFIHYNGYTHKRITPEHILITNDGFVKISDFVLQNAYLADGDKETRDKAPEEILLLGRTTAIDIWNLGLLLFNCLTREHLFKNMADQEIVRLFQSTSPQSMMNELIIARLAECNLNISQECRDFIFACLSVDYTSRPSAQNLLQASFLKQTNTEIVCGKTGASTLNQNQIDEIQALNDVSAGLTTLTSHIPSKGHATTNVQSTLGPMSTKSTKQLANMPPPTPPHANISRIQETEGDSRTISSGFNKQDQEILRRAILNIPSASEECRNSHVISAGDAATLAAVRSPDKSANTFACVPATSNFPMLDDAPNHKQKLRAKSIEAGAKQGKKLKHRVDNRTECVSNQLDDSSFDLQDVKIIGKLEVKKYEEDTTSDNFSEVIENDLVIDKGIHLGSSVADNIQSKPRLAQTNSAVYSSNLSTQKKALTKPQRTASKPGRNCTFSAGDDLIYDVAATDKHSEKTHLKTRRTQRAMSTATTRALARQATYSNAYPRNAGVPNNATRQDPTSTTLATGWAKRELNNKSRKNFPEQISLPGTKDPMFSVNNTDVKRTTCPLSIDALTDHWNSNSDSSDENFLKTSSRSNRNASFKYNSCPHKDLSNDNSCSEISCTDLANHTSSKSPYKLIFGDERSKDHSDRLIASLSVENNVQEPENADVFVDRSQKANLKKVSTVQQPQPKDSPYAVAASPNSPRNKQGYVDNDIGEAYNFSVVPTDGTQPLVLRLGGTPTAKSKLYTAGDATNNAAKQDTCQNDDISINFDTIALPQGQDISSLIQKRQLMLQQIDTHVDDTSSAFSSGTSVANLEKRIGLMDSGKETPKSGAASPSRLVHQPKGFEPGEIANTDINLGGDVIKNQQYVDGSNLSASIGARTKKSYDRFYEDNSVLDRFEEKMTDTSSTYDDYGDLENQDAALFIMTTDKTNVEELREILTNYKINNKISVSSVEQVRRLICSSKRCLAYVKDNFSVNFWFVKFKHLVDTGKEEAILILILISTIARLDFPFCRDIFLMGFIPLANRLYTTHSAINEFLDKWIIPLLVKLISEYEGDSTILQQRAHHKAGMPTDMTLPAAKQQAYNSHALELKAKEAEKKNTATKGNSYAVMRIFESMIVTHTMSFVLRFLFSPVQNERQNKNSFIPNPTTCDLLSLMMEKISEPPHKTIEPHDIAYSILLILFQSKTIFKSEILCEITSPDSPLLNTLMEHVDKSIVYVFLLQDLLFIDAMRGTVLTLLPRLFKKLQKMMDAYELMYTAASHNEDDYDLSASLHIDFSTFSAGISSHNTNVANIVAIGPITALEAGSLRYNLTILLTAITNLLISLSKLVAEPYFSDPFKDYIDIFIQILDKSEEYGNAVPYALSSLHSLLRLNIDYITNFPKIRNIMTNIGKILNGKEAANIYSLQFAIPLALTITRTINPNKFQDKEIKYVLIREIKDNFLHAFLDLIENSSVWRKQCLDSLAHILSYTNEFESTICRNFRLSLTSADYKETLPSLLMSLLSLSESSSIIRSYLASHKELAAGITYILKHNSKDNVNSKVIALKLCLKFSLNCKDSFINTYKSVLSMLPQFRDMNTDQFVIGSSISKQILDTLKLNNSN